MNISITYTDMKEVSFSIKKYLLAFGDYLNDKRNFNRCSPSRRDKDCNNKRQETRRLLL